MQASLNQLAEILAERVGRQMDVPFKEELKVMINYWRSRLITDSLNSRPKDRKFFTKWINMPLEEVNLSDFPDFPNCPILRTTCKVPKSVRANGKKFDFVGKLDRMTGISVNEPHEIKALMGSRFTGKAIRAALINDYMYIFGSLDMPGISLNFPPEDMEEFKSCSAEVEGEGCFNDDDPYPVSGDIQQRIIQGIMSTELRSMATSESLKEEVQIANNDGRKP